MKIGFQYLIMVVEIVSAMIAVEFLRVKLDN